MPNVVAEDSSKPPELLLPSIIASPNFVYTSTRALVRPLVQYFDPYCFLPQFLVLFFPCYIAFHAHCLEYQVCRRVDAVDGKKRCTFLSSVQLYYLKLDGLRL